MYTNFTSACCSVKGPELINMYLGQSEENVREGQFLLANDTVDSNLI